MSLKIKKIDYIIAIILIVLTVVGLSLFLLANNSNDAYVYVYIDNKLVEGAPYPLNVDNTYRYLQDDEKYRDVLIADLEVSIKNNKVAVTYQKSPKNYCANIGYIGLINFPIVCLPNKTLVIIRDRSNNFYV